MAEHVMYNRQISTESGWDNPFRPDGDLSREADEIVSLIKGGKPITPTPNTGVPLLSSDEDEEVISSEKVIAMASLPTSPETKLASPLQQSTPKINMIGTKNGTAVTEIRSGQVEVKRAPPHEPMQPEHVTIKPKSKKCKCCVIQ